MATRMELELTSARPDGSWTWRAAGARQPKGVLDGSILYDGAKVGDIVRAEADVQIDGITILSVTAPRTKAAPERLEIVLPTFYASGRPELAALLAPLFDRPELAPVNRRGSVFWLETRARP